MSLSTFYKKHRKSIVIASTIVSILGLLVIGVVTYKRIFLSSPINVASWYDSNWEQRKAVTISNDSGGDLVDEPVLVEMDTASLITSSKMQEDCDDLRFVDSDDSTPIDFWLEGGCNTANTQIWVKVPDLPSEGKIIYLYYGNASASSIDLDWNGETYVYFDTTCPSGWTRTVDADGKFLYGSNQFGQTGGDSSHDHNNVQCLSSDISTTNISGAGTGSLSGPTSAHQHEGMEVSVDTALVLPPYNSMVLCSKPTLTLPLGSIAMFKNLPGENWTRYSSLDDVFPMADETAGVTGGTSSHTHTLVDGIVTDMTSDVLANGGISATGGTITTSGGYTYHKFTSGGTFTPSGSMSVEVLLVGGGGGGGTDRGGGGGGGGVVTSTITVSGATSAVVGAGAANGGTGGNSQFSSLLANGGGYGGGGKHSGAPVNGGTGGSGGGGGSGEEDVFNVGAGGVGISGQGYNGHVGYNGIGGGGGGAAAVSPSQNGGAGRLVWGTYYGGGGGGSKAYSHSPGSYGVGGIGGGATAPSASGTNGLGGGGAGGGYKGAGGAGGSGVVIVRYLTASSSGTMASSTHTHDSVSGSISTESNIPPYIQVIFGKSTAETYNPSDIILPFSEIPPLGWSRDDSLDYKFVVGGVSYGATGGSATHTHDVSISTGLPSATSTSYGSGSNYADSTHTHSCDTTTNGVSNIPAYYSILYAERNDSQEAVLGEEERQVPDAPTMDSPEALSTTSIRWNFTDNADDETGFKVYDNLNNLVATCATPDLTYCDETGLSANTEYTRKVVSYNASGESEFSTTASAYTLTSVPTISYSGVKTIDSIGLTGAGQVNLSELYFDCIGTGCDTGLNAWDTSNAATATGLNYNTGYDFQIKSRNGNNVETAYSSPINIFTLAGVPTLTSNTVTSSTISLTATNVLNLSAGSSGVYFECVDTDCDTGIKEWVNTDTDVVTSLLPNTQYTFKVKARNYDGTETTYSSELDKYTLSDVPTLTAEAISSSDIQLTADNVANLGDDSSALYFECTGDGCNTGIDEWTTSTIDSVTGLLPNTQYTFRVKSRNGDGLETAYSDTVSIYTQSEIPTISSNILSSTSIELTAGNIGTLGEGNSAIYFECTGDGCDTGLEEWIIADTDTVTGLQPNTQYTFRVKARNYDGTETAYSSPTSVYTYAAAPTVSGNSLTSSSINVTANGVSNLGTGSSAIYFECITESCSEGLNEWITVPTDSVTSLSGNSMYSIRVKARNADGIETAFSESTGIYTQANIPTITAQADSSSAISLTAGNTKNINLGTSGLQFECTGQNCNTGINTWVQAGTDTATNLLPNVEYTFKVKARNYDSIETDYSSNVSKYTLAEVPANLVAASSTDTTVTMTLGVDTNPSSTMYVISESISGKYYNHITDELTETETWISKADLTGDILVKNLTTGTNYNFKIKARNGENVQTAYTSGTSIYTKLLTPAVTTPQVMSSTAITWKFTDTNTTETGFKIYDRDGNLVVTCNQANLTSCQETGLSPNTTYQRKVKAYNTNTESGFSTLSIATTFASASSITSINTVDGDTVVLNINAGNNDVLQVYESTTNSYFNDTLGVLTSATDTNPYSASITVDGLNPNTTYSFRIRSQNSNGISTTWSSYTNVLTLSQAPSISNLSKLANDSIRVFINGRYNPASTQYLLQEVGSGQYVNYSNNALADGEVWGTFTQFGGVDGILVNNLSGDGQYGFRVMARNTDSIRTAYSATQYIGTKSIILNVPDGMKATLTADEQKDLTIEDNGQLGEHDVRVKQDDYLVADIPVSFVEDRDWEDIVLEFAPQVHKTVVKLEDKHGVAGAFTMYVSKGDTDAFRVCPDAKKLNEVAKGCSDETIFIGDFPQTAKVEGKDVSISQVILGGVKYWVADGLTGTGGQGFFEGEDEVVVENTDQETVSSSSGIVNAVTEAPQQIVDGVVMALDDTPLKNLKEVELQTVVTTSTVVTVAVGATTGIGGISQLVYMIGQFFSGILTALGLKRRKITYGFVYDSYTKHPISMAMIRIFNKDGDLVESSVTDSGGRFKGSLEEGTYSLQISKRGFIFPTKFLKGFDDYPLPKIYKGGDFTVTKTDVMNLVIPIDSTDLTGKEKAFTVAKGIFATIFAVLTIAMLFVGIGIAIYMYDSYPTWQNLAISLIYVPSILILLRSISRKKNKYGVVKDEKGKRMSGIEVGLKEVEFGKLIQKRITDDKGRYNFVVDKGDYQIVLLNERLFIDNIQGGYEILAKKDDLLIKKNIRIKSK